MNAHRDKIGATAWIDLRLGAAALEEMERTSDWALGYSVLTAYDVKGTLTFLDDKDFVPFWRTASELGKPIFIHFSSLYKISRADSPIPGYMNDSMLCAGMGQLGGMYPFMLERFDMLYHMHLIGAAKEG